MRQVNIYMASSVKSPRAQNGVGMYVLEAIMAKGPATITKEVKLQEVTANQAELQIMAAAVERLREPCEIDIFTECGYIASGIENLDAWQRNGWKTSRGTEVANVEIWKQIAEKLQNCNVRSRVKEPNEYRSWLKNEIERRLRDGQK